MRLAAALNGRAEILVRRLTRAAALSLALWSLSATAAVIQKDDVHIEGKYLNLLMAANGGGAVQEFGLLATHSDLAAGDGMFLEGFGTDSAYIPNRRLNEKLETLDNVTDRPVLRYSYDCDGPNITGLHVTRTFEPFPNEASVLVHWKIENRGKEELWVSPWVRNEVASPDTGGASDRVDVPALDGIHAVRRDAYFPAARNWIAATDPTKRETVYGVFDANRTFAFLVLHSAQRKLYALQTAFVPKLIPPGGVYETTYRVNIARGLTHVDFATDQFAAQIDYKPGDLEVLIAPAMIIPKALVRASIRAADGQAWDLPPLEVNLTPDKLARFSYAWTAPTDGAYGFTGKVSSGGKTVDLGKDTSSPNGRIDTQFVVGQPDHVTLKPWTDAPFALHRGTRTLKRAMAVSGDVAIWIESPLDKIFQNDVPKPTGTLDSVARVGLARNEHEDFQIVIRPPKGRNLENVRVRCSDLRNGHGDEIPAKNVAIYRVGYVPVTIPSHLEGPTGLFPDILDPFKPGTLRGGVTSPLWFTVYAPPSTPAGVYRGTITIEADQQDPVRITLEATVYNFDLPVTSALKTDFGFNPKTALDWARKLGYTGTAEQLDQAYLKNALEHRVTLRELCALPSETANYPATLNNYVPRLQEALRGGATTIAVPPSLLGEPKLLKEADAFVVKHHLQGRAFCPFADEPPRPAWPRLFENLQQWMNTAPDIPPVVTTRGLAAFLPDPLPIWVVHSQMLDTVNGKPILDRIKSGHEVWWYVNNAPPRPYANFFLDFDAMEHRMLFWQTWALGIRGLHYWSINHLEPGQDPRQSLLSDIPVNGDGFLVYPGPNGPINSIRWETIRDGIEDYDYLSMLTARIHKLEAAGGHEELHKRAQAVYNLQALIPDLVNFTRDPKLLESKRQAIAEMIVAIDKALGGK